MVVVDEPVFPVVPPPPALLPEPELEPWEPVVLVAPPELLEAEVLGDDVDVVLVVLVCWVKGSRPGPGRCENSGVVLSSTTGIPEIGEVTVAPAPTRDRSLRLGRRLGEQHRNRDQRANEDDHDGPQSLLAQVVDQGLQKAHRIGEVATAAGVAPPELELEVLSLVEPLELLDGPAAVAPAMTP